MAGVHEHRVVLPKDLRCIRGVSDVEVAVPGHTVRTLGFEATEAEDAQGLSSRRELASVRPNPPVEQVPVRDVDSWIPHDKGAGDPRWKKVQPPLLEVQTGVGAQVAVAVRPLLPPGEEGPRIGRVGRPDDASVEDSCAQDLEFVFRSIGGAGRLEQVRRDEERVTVEFVDEIGQYT